MAACRDLAKDKFASTEQDACHAKEQPAEMARTTTQRSSNCETARRSMIAKSTRSSDLKSREWEVKQLESKQDKTIVEHVHFLEEAKRVTDRQLADAQKGCRRALPTFTRSKNRRPG